MGGTVRQCWSVPTAADGTRTGTRRSSARAHFLLVLAGFVALVACGVASAQSRSDSLGWSGRRVLVVYLTRTNNTKAVAQLIHDVVGGNLVELQLQTPYPADYLATVQQVARENETGFLPPLKTAIDRLESYDVVFVGFPTWGMQLPPPMKSFLRQHDLSDKTVIPFNTNAGYGTGTSFQTVAQLCPRSTVLEGLTVRGGIERDGELFVMDGARLADTRREVARWLNKLDALVPRVRAEYVGETRSGTGKNLVKGTGHMNSRTLTLALAVVLLVANGSNAQTGTTDQLIQLSKNKWRWMADKSVDKLEPLFHDRAKFVHMSGTWKKAEELDIIKTGSIWYKQTDVHDVAAEWSTIRRSSGAAPRSRPSCAGPMPRPSSRRPRCTSGKARTGSCWR